MAKIWTYPGDYKAFKGLIAAQYTDQAVKATTKGEFELAEKTPEFLKKSPLGRVPVLEFEDGQVLLESNAIARHFARAKPELKLMGDSMMEQAKVDEWVDWCANELEVPLTLWLFPVLEFYPFNPKATAKGQKDTKASLKVLNAYLADKTYMVGESVTLADICVTASLYYPMKMLFDYKFRNSFPHVVRHYLTCSSLPEFASVLGGMNLCIREVKAKAPKKEKKKAAAKKKKKKVVAAAPKKKKHPCELLARPKVALDEWKRKYSNSKKSEAGYYESFQWMLDNLDFKEDYSLWRCSFQFQEENTNDIAVENAINGFVQRLEEVRKYAFGVMQVLGTKEACGGYFPIEGAFLMRGQDVQPLIDSNGECTVYNWTKAEIDNKKLVDEVAQIWCSWDSLDKVKAGAQIESSAIFK